MPGINRYVCDRCGFALRTGWGRHTYAVDPQGERVVCHHPGEMRAMWRITGKQYTYTEAIELGVMGYEDHCTCRDCLQQFPLDLKRDERRCEYCSSTNVETLWEMVDRRCPECDEGVIREIITGAGA